MIGLIVLAGSLTFILSVCFLDSGSGDTSAGDAEFSISGKLNYSDSSDTTLSSGNTIDFQTTTSIPHSITFTIINTGDGTLNLTGSPLVAISGTDSEDFVVTTAPDSSISSGASTEFIITFSSDYLGGSRDANLIIETNDPNQASFSLTLTGVAGVS